MLFFIETKASFTYLRLGILFFNGVGTQIIIKSHSVIFSKDEKNLPFLFIIFIFLLSILLI
jgi:hypothetical protein